MGVVRFGFGGRKMQICVNAWLPSFSHLPAIASLPLWGIATFDFYRLSRGYSLPTFSNAPNTVELNVLPLVYCHFF